MTGSQEEGAYEDPTAKQATTIYADATRYRELHEGRLVCFCGTKEPRVMARVFAGPPDERGATYWLVVDKKRQGALGPAEPARAGLLPRVPDEVSPPLSVECRHCRAVWWFFFGGKPGGPFHPNMAEPVASRFRGLVGVAEDDSAS